MTLLKTIEDRSRDPHVMRLFHKWSTIFWIALIPIIMVWFAKSVPFVNFMSAWALVVSHWTAYAAFKQEDNQNSSDAKN